MKQQISQIDYKIIEWIRVNVKRRKWMTWIARTINIVGKGGLMWIVLAVALMFTKYFKVGLFIILGDLGYFVLIESLVKRFLFRNRPFVDNKLIELEVKKPGNSSFPSGHCVIAMCSTILLFHISIWIGLIALVFTAVIALSRLYLMVHYPSDVLSGLLVGAIFGVILSLFL
ncbi:phosphatase PAP2 family protein [Pediococcus claussenii]|nr:phosphatase PAP2 family protein [Pediococcus claussenii]ANZ69437.1 hypothetical protein AYR57_03545 [Pediococcus claussenii]ANZ71257.1 hypothetical protein AYR58_03560 [Pediococcus claussenii]